jgi:protein-S-isoprenylcysteine O-methyltransferase Ste14
LVIQLLLVVVVVPFLPLLISRQWNWWEAWAFAIVNNLTFVISRVLAARRNPDLLAERARFMRHEDAKSWDKALSPIVGLGSGLIPLVAGLDALYDWSPAIRLPIVLVSMFLFLAGYALSSYALIENRFFSGMVRIQTDRGHQVVSSGPYHWVRHPGYAGAILAYLATPLFLSSYWAFLPALLIIVILVIRTNLEDKTLQYELTGYREYTMHVHYRLLPGIW